MPSPFPGMDPYLEINPRWEGFYDWFVRELARQTMSKARELNCWIDVERTIELATMPYLIFVARKTPTGRKEEAYPLRLQDHLPTIGLPIGPPRPDLPLDMASAFRAAYDLSIRPGSVNYRQEAIPPPPLSEENAAWVRKLLAEQP